MAELSSGEQPAAPPSCRVLIIDDDADSLEEYREAAVSLGYPCVTASDALSALQLVAGDPSIGIVVTDLSMPAMNGLALLDELAARFAQTRPIVSLVVTGCGSLEAAVEAMRACAKDFLTKPVSTEDFAAALRRAWRSWHELRQGAVGKAEPGAELDPPSPQPEPPAGPEALLAKARAIVALRARRARYLDPGLFADPTWDLMLDLTIAALEGSSVPVSSACASTNVPLSTALRYVRALVAAGLVRRWNDPHDRRRDLLALEDHALAAMTRYLADTPAVPMPGKGKGKGPVTPAGS